MPTILEIVSDFEQHVSEGDVCNYLAAVLRQYGSFELPLLPENEKQIKASLQSDALLRNQIGFAGEELDVPFTMAKLSHLTERATALVRETQN